MALTFKTGVCRECKAKWTLDKTYGKASLLESLKTLAVCPKCKGIRCSFPYEGDAPKKAEAIEAKPSIVAFNDVAPDPDKPATPPKTVREALKPDDEPF